MNQQELDKIHHDEIASLAYLNWRHDGSPHGRDKQYWYEAEHQLMATKSLMVAEHNHDQPLLEGGRIQIADKIGDTNRVAKNPAPKRIRKKAVTTA